ncbi:MAG: hypothetical protein F6K22_16820 [Okeania sp. SIO2F4]|uniref:hypothetical protein n=1 Tax=Okeania sp. SIO2F4 TaxID=2607790 RepID=UPI001429232B|nr:hypothetical protein [Okeania sp. SIO2F4]NES04344.1 hypothetical protein [Okeania sp. SIO2F4]
MAYWIKINYERSIYLIDLDSITAFSCQSNKLITFWLPNSSQPIILNKQNSEHDYHLVLEYIKKKIEIEYKIYNECWVKIIYDRHEWLINLSCITTFALEPNGRITFWLPDSTKDIIINPNSEPEAYKKVSEFIIKVTGYSLP